MLAAFSVKSIAGIMPYSRDEKSQLSRNLWWSKSRDKMSRKQRKNWLQNARNRNPVLMFQQSFAIFSLFWPVFGEGKLFLLIFHESVSWDQRFSQHPMKADPLLINLCISLQGRLVIMLVYYQMEKFSSLQNWKVRILDNIGIFFKKIPR